MDNKKLYKRLSTFFWFSLAILPFVICLIQFIGYHLTFNSGISSSSDLISYHNDISGSYDNILLKFVTNWRNFCFPFVLSPFDSLFSALGFSGNVLRILSGCFSWFVCVYMLEILIDVFVWLPKFIHNGLEKWGA